MCNIQLYSQRVSYYNKILLLALHSLVVRQQNDGHHKSVRFLLYFIYAKMFSFEIFTFIRLQILNCHIFSYYIHKKRRKRWSFIRKVYNLLLGFFCFSFLPIVHDMYTTLQKVTLFVYSGKVFHKNRSLFMQKCY